MSSLPKSNLLTGVIATHFAGMMLLLQESNNHWLSSVYYGMPVRTLFLVYFFFDLATFLMFLFPRPYLEGGARVVGLFWTLQMTTVLLPTGIGAVFLFVCSIEIVLLAWPKRYMTIEEDEIEERAENITRAKCANCGAMYTYCPDSIVNGEVICQNCGKSFGIQLVIAQSF